MTIKEWTHSHTRTVIAAVLVVGILAFLYVHESKNKGQELAELKVYIASHETERAKETSADKAQLAAAMAKIDALEKQKQQVITQPSLAPQIIERYIPTSTPIQQTAPITKDTPPDAPVAVLTRKNEQDLATFGLTCSQCSTERDALRTSVETKEASIKTLTAERDKAIQTANGGSTWHRVWTVVKLSGCGGIGALVGGKASALANQRTDFGAGIGASAGVLTCSLLGKK